MYVKYNRLSSESRVSWKEQRKNEITIYTLSLGKTWGNIFLYMDHHQQLHFSLTVWYMMMHKYSTSENEWINMCKEQKYSKICKSRKYRNQSHISLSTVISFTSSQRHFTRHNAHHRITSYVSPYPAFPSPLSFHHANLLSFSSLPFLLSFP